MKLWDFSKSWWQKSVDVNLHDNVGFDGKRAVLSVPQAFGVYQACITVSQGAWSVLFSSTCHRIWANRRQYRSQWNHTSRGNIAHSADAAKKSSPCLLRPVQSDDMSDEMSLTSGVGTAWLCWQETSSYGCDLHLLCSLLWSACTKSN